MTSPDISVIMPAWKSAGFIGPAIESVLEQRGVSLELIIVDDASPERLEPAILAASAGDKRVVYERLETNSGPSVARNRAIELSRGAFIAVLDDDDAMAPDRLARLLAAARRYSADIVVDNMRPVYAPDPLPSAARFLELEADADPQIITLCDYIDPQTEKKLGGGLGYLKPIFRKSTLDRLALRYDRRLRNSEDFYLVAEMLAQGSKMVLMPGADYYYTVREGSLSHRLSAANARDIVAAEEAFRQTHLHRFDAPTARASNRQYKQRRHYLAVAETVEAIKAFRLLELIKVAGAYPGSIPYVVKALLKIVSTKLRGRKQRA